MHIQQQVKDALSEHKQKIELTQWAIINSLSSLVYSEYIRNIVQKQVPVRMVMVPRIKAVEELLDMNGPFIKMISDDLLGEMINNPLFKKYSDAPELVMFRPANIDIMKTILDLYILPNVIRSIPSVISTKFQLTNESQQLFRENREADLFDRQSISHSQFQYIVEETILQLLCILPTMRKDIELPEGNVNINLTDDQIMTIDHENAICPIHFSKGVITNESVIDLLSFVTSTTIREIDWSATSSPLFKNGEVVTYSIDTNPFNQVVIMTLGGIETSMS